MPLSILIYGLSLFSGIWIFLGLSYIGTEIGFNDLGSINPSDLGVMVTSIVGPILVAVLIMILAYNHTFLKRLGANQEVFVNMIQKNYDFSKKIEQEKLSLIMLDKVSKITDILLLRVADIISGLGVFSNEELQNLWQSYFNGNKYAFLNMISSLEYASVVSTRIEAKIIQNNEFSKDIIDICNSYDNIYDLLVKYDGEQAFIHNFTTNPLARFIKKVSSYKKTEKALIEQRMARLDESSNNRPNIPPITTSSIEESSANNKNSKNPSETYENNRDNKNNIDLEPSLLTNRDSSITSLESSIFSNSEASITHNTEPSIISMSTPQTLTTKSSFSPTPTSHFKPPIFDDEPPMEEDLEENTINWKEEQHELIDKYRRFASSVKNNIDNGIINEK